MREIVLGTTSKDKSRELRLLLADLPVRWVKLEEFGQPPEVAETGGTFVENARLKALKLSDWCKRPVLADDSGLEVEALNSAPGVNSKRFAGENATDQDRNRKLLEMLAHLPPERRRARYVCALVLAFRGRVLIQVEGTLVGRIAPTPRGSAGFGYDPLFIPEGYQHTIGQLGEEVKHRISHRARAAERFKEEFLKLLRPPGGESPPPPT